ncbi:MAG: polyisoprenoid-binding protein [Fuscovulum sp.]|jgi:polyisoprenoid-binding protein YceI|nr:polyisoprenoid-binding protein [Fuscovulum sp.]
MLRILLLCTTLALPATAQDLPAPVAGTYQLDRTHSRILFKVNHLGFSTYIAPFTGVEATLAFAPDDPEAMTVTATIAADSVETLYPDPALDFNAVIEGPEFLDAATFPQITFTSTSVTLTGPNSANVTGDLTLHGVTRPITLEVTYNGGWGAMPMDPAGARIGFSVTGSLNRSDFGIGYGLPAPGTTMGVWDEVKIEIETEFTSTEAAVPLP